MSISFVSPATGVDADETSRAAHRSPYAPRWLSAGCLTILHLKPLAFLVTRKQETACVHGLCPECGGSGIVHCCERRAARWMPGAFAGSHAGACISAGAP